MIHIIIIAIYLSFLIDLVLFPVQSEASTMSLMRSGESRKNSFLLAILWLVSIVTYITPLGISVSQLTGNGFLPVSPLASMGVAFAILGRVVSLWGTFSIRKPGVDGLVTQSAFRWTRNPISLGIHITLLGLLLVYAASLLWIGFIAFLINIHIRILLEERHLKKRFGSEYQAYVQSTPRYILI